MIHKVNLLILMVFISVQIGFSQKVENEKKGEISPELKKEAVAFLRETGGEVNNLRTLENRISFSAEIASLMWYQDEKEARTMFQSVINDFRGLFGQFDSQISAPDSVPDIASGYSNDTSEKAQLSRKFMKAINVRQQIATTIAEHDPQLALEFFTASGQAISNPALRKQIESGDAYFETRLLSQIAAQDAGTALEYGRKILAKGFNYEILSLLQKIYKKDAEKGAAFGEEVADKIKNNSSSPDNLYNIHSLLSLGVSNLAEIKGKPDKKPLFKEQTLRELAEKMAQLLLKRGDSEGNDLSEYMSQIEKFSPAGAGQLRQKFGVKPVKNDNAALVGKTGYGIVATGETVQPGKSENDAQEKLSDNISKLGTKQLPKEERERVFGQARKIIAEMKDPTQKLAALSGLALQINAAGDKELAVQILDEARTTLTPAPKNYVDFMQTWILAGGYAQVDSEKAFPVLEDAIFRLNDTIGAFVKVGEFMDVRGDIIEDGEIQVGSFGGSLTRELISGLGQSDTTIRSLALADFARTKSLSNKFDRMEVRILAKMLVLRAVLGNQKNSDEMN